MGFDAKRRLGVFWREWVKPIGVVLIICCSFRSAVADWNDVPTGSMKPTILEGDRIFVNRMAYGLRVPFTSWEFAQFDGPQRGDIAVFFCPEDGVHMVKRVVGVPGDRIEMRRNRLLVNGEVAAYDELDPDLFAALADQERAQYRFATETVDGMDHSMMVRPAGSARCSFKPLVVPDGEYFMMGDNRDNSRDSRWFGCVKRELITGQATSVILSVDSDNYYWPRGDRFFRALD